MLLIKKTGLSVFCRFFVGFFVGFLSVFKIKKLKLVVNKNAEENAGMVKKAWAWSKLVQKGQNREKGLVVVQSGPKRLSEISRKNIF